MTPDRAPLYYYHAQQKRRKLREDIEAVGKWLHRYVAPGWLFVLMAVCVLIIVHINATTAVLNTCGR